MAMRLLDIECVLLEHFLVFCLSLLLSRRALASAGALAYFASAGSAATFGATVDGRSLICGYTSLANRVMLRTVRL